MSWVIIVSRSLWPWRMPAAPPKAGPPSSASSPKPAPLPPGALLLKKLVRMVMQREGALSFLVRRMEADVAFEAERRARRRGWRGTSRLMVLWSAADWMV